MLRRYWWPVELSEYLKPKDRPKKIRVLGENLVLFREGCGRPGLLALNCSTVGHPSNLVERCSRDTIR